MGLTTRRGFMKRAAVAAGGAGAAGFSPGEAHARFGRSANSRDVQIEHISIGYEEHVFRAPLKFARAVVDRQTLLTVQCTVRTASGQGASGFGTLPLNYTFTFPS